MTDITKIPIAVLRADLIDTKEDIMACKNALKVGVMEYSGGSVQDRFDTNLKIKDLIEKELKRRN